MRMRILHEVIKVLSKLWLGS